MLTLKNEGGLYLAYVYLPYRNSDKLEPVQLVLDTGALITIIDTGFTDYLGYSIRDSVKLSSLDGAAGKSRGYIIKVSKFKCFGYEMNNFEIACHDMTSKLGVSGLLGMNFLKNFNMDINFSKGIINKIERVT